MSIPPEERTTIVPAAAPGQVVELTMSLAGFTAGFEALADWEQHQILSSLQRIVALMEARDVAAGPILATGPLGGENGDA